MGLATLTRLRPNADFDDQRVSTCTSLDEYSTVAHPCKGRMGSALCVTSYSCLHFGPSFLANRWVSLSCVVALRCAGSLEYLSRAFVLPGALPERHTDPVSVRAGDLERSSWSLLPPAGLLMYARSL